MRRKDPRADANPPGAWPTWIEADMSDRTCNVESCERGVFSRGWCGMHYQRHWKHGDPEYVNPELAPNNKRRRRRCALASCERVSDSRGYCKMHATRLRREGTPEGVRPAPRAADPDNVYVLVTRNSKSVGEHRIVMEQVLGRALVPGENVHHRNGVRFDNRPENLELWNTAQPAGQRPADKVTFALEMLELYAPHLLR